MLVYLDELHRLDYATAQGVLMVELQGQRQFSPSELKKIFVSTVACVREHAIEKLLVDFAKSTVNIADSDYKSLMAQLAVGLMHSSVRKVARVAPHERARDEKVDSVYREIKAAVRLSLEFRNFDSRAAAIAWLTDP